MKMLKGLILSSLLMGFLYGNLAFACFGSDQQENVNQRSADGKKQGRWIYYGKDRPSAGFPAKGKIEEGDYKDDRREGLWIIYHNDGVTPKLKGEYVNNRPNGKYVKYHMNGKIKEQGTFVSGQYSDTLVRFHPNGQVEYQAVYNGQGKEQGKVRYYYLNGQVEYEYHTENGIVSGKAMRYYENGDVKEIIEYNADGTLKSSIQKEMETPTVRIPEPTAAASAPKITKPIVKDGKFQPNGYNKVYNTNNEIWQDGDFKEGRLFNGKVYVYDRDGILLKVKVFKNGVYHSDGQL